MNRCISRLATLALATALALSSALLSLPGLAQSDAPTPVVRQFPKEVKRGEMQMLLAPDILMDGKPDRLTMGSRIRDASNRLVLPGQITNQTFLVNYLRENEGPVHLVWILNSEEAKVRLPGSGRTFWEFLTGVEELPAASSTAQ